MVSTAWSDLWQRVLVKIQELLLRKSEARRPGYIGSIPVLEAFRWLVVAAIVLRGVTHPSHTGPDWAWYPLLALAALYSALRYWRPEWAGERPLHWLLVVSDVVILGRIFWTTREAQSDIFLLNGLPVLWAMEFLGVRASFWMAAAVSGAFFVVLWPVSQSLTGFAVVYLTREVFFLAILASCPALIALTRRARMQKQTIAEKLFDFQQAAEHMTECKQVRASALEATRSMAAAVAGGSKLFIGRLDLDGECDPPWPGGLPPELAGLLAAHCIKPRRTLRLREVDILAPAGWAAPGHARSLVAAPLSGYRSQPACLFAVSSEPDEFNPHFESSLGTLARVAEAAIGRLEIMRVFQGLSRKIGEAAANREAVLAPILAKLECYGFQIAAISVVDEYRGTIEMIAARHVEPGWMRRSRYAIEGPDIIATTARTQQTYEIGRQALDMDDPHLNKELCQRFGHQRLVRAYVPVVAGDRCVAVLQVGCERKDTERVERVFAPENLRRVRQLADAQAHAIAGIRPFVLLQEIAQTAVDIISADSATIHVYREGDLILQAGAGLASPDFVRRHPPEAESLGGDARGGFLKEQEDDPNRLQARCPRMYGSGVRACIQYPLSLGPGIHGILRVHFWKQPHTLAPTEQQLEWLFGGLTEVAIQDYLRIESAAREVDRVRVFARFRTVLDSLSSGSDLSEVLENVAQSLLLTLDADLVTLYQYFESEGRLETPPVRKGSFRAEESMAGRLRSDSIPYEIARGGQPRFHEEIAGTALTQGPGTRFAEREEVKACAMLPLRSPEGEVVGVVFVNYREQHTFTEEEKEFTSTLASSAAMAIRTARLKQHTTVSARRERALKALSKVDAAIAEGVPRNDLPGVLRLIVEEACAVTGAPAGMIFWHFRRDALELAAAWGLPSGAEPRYADPREGLVGWAAEKSIPILASDVREKPWRDRYRQILEETRSELAFPVIDRGKLLGVLNLEHSRVGAFTNEAVDFVRALAIQAAMASRMVDLHQEVERSEKPIRAMREVAGRILGARGDADTVLQWVLTGVTAGEGLGFTRAMILLVDGPGKALRGHLGVGQLSAAETRNVWEQLQTMTDQVCTQSGDMLTWLLDEATRFRLAVRQGSQSESRLTQMIRRFSLPVDSLEGKLADVYTTAHACAVAAGEDDPLRRELRKLDDTLEFSGTFALVPLLGREAEKMGILVADSDVLDRERKLDARDLRLLEAFAELAAVGVQNAHVWELPLDDQKEAVWSENIKDLMHCLTTGIALLELDVAAIRSAISGDTAPRPAVAALVGPLRQRVGDLQSIVEDVRNYRFPMQSYRRVPVRLAPWLQGFKRELEAAYGCEVSLTVEETSLEIEGDTDRLNWVLTELAANASRACTGADRALRLTLRLEAGTVAGGGRSAALHFEDNGPGIPDNLRPWIFRRGVTSGKPGHGRGLAIVRDILWSHWATIEVVQTGMGAHFLMRFPARESAGVAKAAAE